MISFQFRQSHLYRQSAQGESQFWHYFERCSSAKALLIYKGRTSLYSRNSSLFNFIDAKKPTAEADNFTATHFLLSGITRQISQLPTTVDLLSNIFKNFSTSIILYFVFLFSPSYSAVYTSPLSASTIGKILPETFLCFTALKTKQSRHETPITGNSRNCP